MGSSISIVISTQNLKKWENKPIETKNPSQIAKNGVLLVWGGLAYLFKELSYQRPKKIRYKV